MLRAISQQENDKGIKAEHSHSLPDKISTKAPRSNDQIQEIISTHLRSLPALTKKIRDHLWSNIANIWELVGRSPQDIVMTFEIVEMHQGYLDR